MINFTKEQALTIIDDSIAYFQVPEHHNMNGGYVNGDLSDYYPHDLPEDGAYCVVGVITLSAVRRYISLFDPTRDAFGQIHCSSNLDNTLFEIAHELYGVAQTDANDRKGIGAALAILAKTREYVEIYYESEA